MTILDQLAEHARERVRQDRRNLGLEEIREMALSAGRGNGEAFYRAVAKPGMRFICEVKKASPSKGVIDPVFDYMNIAAAYEEAGADCISCLTEPKWFMGSDEIFSRIRGAVKTPMLRKDFVVDEYQLYQSRLMGADCVLLICSLLDMDTIRRYSGICEQLGLAVLTETHDEKEIRSAVNAGARMIGVNNRNLRDFTVDLGNAVRLREMIPESCLYVSESGVRGPEDVAVLAEAGADAVLVGEALMRAEDKNAFLQRLKEASVH
ncbi:MAG: indole-3-glycerol phosphate synthase TrpC [Blautia sp.]|nr:indole-3-glycerol phosphate synthase TrpC [Blautia sp.]